MPDFKWYRGDTLSLSVSFPNRTAKYPRMKPVHGLDQVEKQKRGFVCSTNSMACAIEFGGTSLCALG